MEPHHSTGRSEAPPSRRPSDDHDPTVALLREATATHLAVHEELREERAIRLQLESNNDALRQANGILETVHETLRTEVEQLRIKEEVERARPTALVASIQSMHRALYVGSTSSHILRASLDVTHSERGYCRGRTGWDAHSRRRGRSGARR